MSLYGRNQHHIVKQLSSNLKHINSKKNPAADTPLLASFLTHKTTVPPLSFDEVRSERAPGQHLVPNKQSIHSSFLPLCTDAASKSQSPWASHILHILQAQELTPFAPDFFFFKSFCIINNPGRERMSSFGAKHRQALLFSRQVLSNSLQTNCYCAL